MAEIIWRSTMPCPKCCADGGRPYRVESKSTEQVIIALRCAGCGHEWSTERDTPWLNATPDKCTPPEEPA